MGHFRGSLFVDVVGHFWSLIVVLVVAAVVVVAEEVLTGVVLEAKIASKWTSESTKR